MGGVNILGCMGSGNMLQRQNKGLWNLGECMQGCKGEEEGEGLHVLQRQCLLGKEQVGEGHRHAREGERERAPHWVLCLEVFYTEVPEEISIEYSSALQGCLLKVEVSTDWLTLMKEVIRHCSWS